MKLAVLNDLPVAGVLTGGHGSGTEISIGNFVREGHRRGHIVDVIVPEYCTPDLLGEYDLLVAKNVHSFNPDQLNLIASKKFVAWPSDHQWTKLRLFFAFQEQKPDPQRQQWETWFKKSKAIVYLSPLHADCCHWAMPGLKDHPSALCPPIVDVDLFKPDPDGWEPDTAATINGGLPFKGLHNQLDWAYAHPEVQFTFIGAIRENVQLPPNAKFVGRLPWREMAKLLGKTETYVELPQSPQPYNQSSVIGSLACKKVTTNRLMGAASYPWFGHRDETRIAMRRAMPDLWRALEGLN